MKVNSEAYNKPKLKEIISKEFSNAGFRRIEKIVDINNPVEGEYHVYENSKTKAIVYRGCIDGKYIDEIKISLLPDSQFGESVVYQIQVSVDNYNEFFVGRTTEDFQIDFNTVLEEINWHPTKKYSWGSEEEFEAAKRRVFGEKRKSVKVKRRFEETVEDVEEAYRKEVIEAFCTESRLCKPCDIVDAVEDVGGDWYMTHIDPVTYKAEIYKYNVDTNTSKFYCYE